MGNACEGDESKVIILESIDVWCMTWSIICGMSKVEFYKQAAYLKEGRQSRNFGNLDLRKLRKATRQVHATLATTIVPLANRMLHITCTFLMGEKIVDKILPMRTKWKDLLVDVNVLGEKASLEPILLSKLSMIMKTNFNNYMTYRHGDKFAQCSKCNTLERLWNAHTIETKSYVTHQLNHFKDARGAI